MKAPRAFTSPLAADIVRYLTVKQALGREYDGVRRVLAHIDHFVTSRGGDLPPDTFAGWCLTLQPLASGTRRHRMRVVRNFRLYRRRDVPTAFVPDKPLFPPEHQVVRPHLFTEAEVLRLLDLVTALPAAPTSPFRRENLHLAIAILYTTGLRLGELVRLTFSDYDPHGQTLLIRDSTFHKSRLVPLSRDGAREIDGYLALRRTRQLAISPDSPLLWHSIRRGTAYTCTGLGHAMRPLLRAAQIKTQTGRLPRVHDFRHTFAVEALLRWYRIGADVNAKLPLLATYMGHVSIVSTEYYLQLSSRLPRWPVSDSLATVALSSPYRLPAEVHDEGAATEYLGPPPARFLCGSSSPPRGRAPQYRRHAQRAARGDSRVLSILCGGASRAHRALPAGLGRALQARALASG